MLDPSPAYSHGENDVSSSSYYVLKVIRHSINGGIYWSIFLKAFLCRPVIEFPSRGGLNVPEPKLSDRRLKAASILI